MSQTILLALVYFAFIGVHLLTRRYVIFTWALLLLPFLIAPYFITHDSAGVFIWVKLFSVFIGIAALDIFRFHSVLNPKWLGPFIYLLLQINILEAVIAGLNAGELYNMINALAGAILMITLTGISSIKVDKRSKYHSLKWGSMGIGWIIFYTIWNWAFIVMNFPDVAGIQLMALLAAFTIALKDPSRWLQTRAYTLFAAFLGIFFYFKHAGTYTNGGMLSPLDTTSWADPDLFMGLALASITYAVIYLIRFTKKELS